MPRRSIQERLRQLEARRNVLVARLGREERARDTRRKILIGALVLDRVERQPAPPIIGRLDDWLRAELPGFLTREKDRDLFEDILGRTEPDEKDKTEGTEEKEETRDTRETEQPEGISTDGEEQP